MSVALVTGGSAGLGLALTRALVTDGWQVVTDARHAAALERAVADLGEAVVPVPGDVSDPTHRADLAAVVRRLGRLDLLVHGASTLGPLPMRPLRALEPEELDRVWSVNAAAPMALTRELLPVLVESRGVLLSISSDAAVEHYETWGAYAATKAALDHLTLTLAAEEGIAAYAVDPGDMRTAMHQDAFPGEDISDRPLPETVVPALLELVRRRPRAGRLRASDLARPEAAR
ncbi:short-chain dehydrogenase [Marmoricola endophyticus]|uniref:Short-chain dehydrogenase n=1 Tax=Marmoricola endophyticus TaxID=2040280 RepID=A0A917BFE4_9ACTN|nr:SDR family NAD(P)-dependent oxidoreductase [Marmoricola endophyticus]GGF38131.1 short-chain dehydrogenase [Marmoricola endophyticus]